MSEEDVEKTQQQAEEEQKQPRSGQSKGKRDTKKVADLKQQVEDLTHDLQRERSDFANYQRRMESEKEQILSRARSEVITQLLPLFDDLERALSHVPEELRGNPWAQGVGKVYEQAQEKMNDMGVARIDALHQPFDPQLHEAVEFEEGDGNDEIVTEVLRTGYTLNDTVVRPAMVKVGNPSEQSRPTDNNEQSKEEQENKEEE